MHNIIRGKNHYYVARRVWGHAQHGTRGTRGKGHVTRGKGQAQHGTRGKGHAEHVTKEGSCRTRHKR